MIYMRQVVEVQETVKLFIIKINRYTRTGKVQGKCVVFITIIK